MRQLLQRLLRIINGPSYEEAMEEARPSKAIKDRYGNKLEICKKCNVPVITQRGTNKCMNGCDFGHWYMRFDDSPKASNNYNPTKHRWCDLCQGNGKHYFQEGGEWCAKLCNPCQGVGSFQVRRYTEAEEVALSQPLQLDVDEQGWTRCPRCNFRFMVTDPNVWLEDRHRRCNQKLVYTI